MFPSTPFVKLGQNFRNISELLKRFGSIPDLLELDHLSVSGDVTFGKQVCSVMSCHVMSCSHCHYNCSLQVSLKGTVIVIANHGDRIDIPAGSCLENKIVSGNLRIMDH